MTVQEIAKHTGFTKHSIYKFIREGEIEITKAKTKHGYKIDVDAGYIPVLKKRKKSAVVGKKAEVKVKCDDKRKLKNQPLRAAVVQLMEYNKKHNLNLSYGQATAMNVI
jgi:excisionase family DNA binding protein